MNKGTQKILVIITTYNRPEECGRLLDGLNGITSHDFDVFLTENKSNADYTKVVSRDYKFKLKYKKMDDNYGLPITYNLAIIYAIDNNYDYIWVLDDDTAVEADTLRYMVEELQNNERAALTGSAIYDIDRKSELLHSGAFFDFKEMDHIHNMTTDGVSRVDYVADCSSLARVSLIRKHGIFYDESYFIHVEDLDFPLMFKRLGYEITVDPRSKVYHKSWAQVYETRFYMEYYDIRNMLYLTIKFKPEIFRGGHILKAQTERNIYHFLFMSVINYLVGNVHIARFYYNAVKDLYDCRMHKSDVYKRASLEMIKGRLRGKTVVLAGRFAESECDAISDLLSKHIENCEIAHFNHDTRLKKAMGALSQFKKFDYVVIPGPKYGNPLYPLLGKKILKLENGALCTYRFGYIRLLCFSAKASMLAIRVYLRKTFRFDSWTGKLLWSWEKNAEIVRALGK